MIAVHGWMINIGVMARKTVNKGDTGLVARTAINDNFTELYSLSEIPQYFVMTDGTTQWRIGVRNGKCIRDRTLTATGFDGVEDDDWENIIEES